MQQLTKFRYYDAVAYKRANPPKSAVHTEFLRTGRIDRTAGNWSPSEKRYLSHQEVAERTGRRLERAGRRFMSECDSEIIAVYLAQEMTQGATLEEAMHKSLDELDGVFTYIAVTKDELGVAKDELAAKPLVLYESDDLVVLASEEIAIRAVVDREIDTYDPYEREVLVWQR